MKEPIIFEYKEFKKVWCEEEYSIDKLQSLTDQGWTIFQVISYTKESYDRVMKKYLETKCFIIAHQDIEVKND